MDVGKENMTPKEMLQKIAELDYSQSQLKELNTAMRQWLDVADDDMAALRSENDALRRQVNVLDRLVSEAQQVEAEPSGFLLTDDLDVRSCSEKKIQKLEEESTMMKEQNKKLTAELKNLQQENEQDKIGLSKFKAALQSLEIEMEESHVGLQRRDENLHQKNLQLKSLEETVEECSIIIKDLRQTNQELREQLEDRQDEALLSALNDLTEDKDGSLSFPLPLFEEIKLLASSDECKSSASDFRRPSHEETEEAEELLKPQSPTVDLQTERWTGTVEMGVQKARRLLMTCISVLLVLAFVATGVSLGDCNLFSIKTLWTGARVTLQPYCSVHYGDLPPL